jgi:hypothetical protein
MFFRKRKHRDGPRPPRPTEGIMVDAYRPVGPIERPIVPPPKPPDAHMAIPPRYRKDR